jgi:hypothetical protein
VLPAAGENQLKNAQSPSRPMHALLGAFSSFATESNEEIIIGGSGPDGIRCDKNTTNTEALMGFDLFHEFIANWVNLVQEAIFQTHPDRLFRGENIGIKKVGKGSHRI